MAFGRRLRGKTKTNGVATKITAKAQQNYSRLKPIQQNPGSERSNGIVVLEKTMRATDGKLRLTDQDQCHRHNDRRTRTILSRHLQLITMLDVCDVSPDDFRAIVILQNDAQGIIFERPLLVHGVQAMRCIRSQIIQAEREG